MKGKISFDGGCWTCACGVVSRKLIDLRHNGKCTAHPSYVPRVRKPKAETPKAKAVRKPAAKRTRTRKQEAVAA